MKVIIVKNYEEMSKMASDVFVKQITEKNNSVLGLATGGTPELMYKLLIEENKNKHVSFKDVKTFNLDEYIGITSDHEMSYRTFMNKNLFHNIDINLANTFVPNGEKDVEQSAKDYDKQIDAAGGIDLQILGIGLNAHIAFNEPPAPIDAMTSIVQLTESTINANSRYFSSADDVPKQAITMGIGSILKAKKIILLASGKAKAQAIFDTVNAKPNPTVPASFLQTHNDVTLIIDEDAAEMLNK